ncbi:MAG: hypothetical protein KGP28_03065 [Bdellovibrionales bacterium]|nr:hypothetical protein [Bdellovibrionales bacterium]
MMKFMKFVVLLALLQNLPARAEVLDPTAMDSAMTNQGIALAEEAELATLPGDESLAHPRQIRVKEIREYLKTADVTKTCMDEMIRLRGRMILKLSLKPVEGVVEFAGGIYLGFFAGAMIAGRTNGWDALVGGVLGGLAGAGGAIIYTGVDTSVTAVRLHRLNLILKALGEQVLEREGSKTEALYDFYQGRSSNVPMAKEAFVAKLLEADRSGALCDGSMVPHRIFRRGLRARVAGAKEFVNAIMQ